MRHFDVALVVCLAAGCGGSAFVASDGTGGSGSVTGGAPGSGGSTAAGGAPGTGGLTASSGGSTATGGAPGTGGATVGVGGSPAGGASGTGGAPGTGGIVHVDAGPATGGSSGVDAGPTPFLGECKTAAECELFTDCCSCQAVPKGATPVSCKMMCLQSDCAAHGVTATDVTCLAGRCVLARNCNEKAVTCQVAVPACASEVGMAPIVVGSCYQGSCLAVAECSSVTSCDVCTKAGLACVTDNVRGGPTYHCVSTPEKCQAAPTCACMGVCTGGYQCSAPLGKDLVCSCPTC